MNKFRKVRKKVIGICLTPQEFILLPYELVLPIFITQAKQVQVYGFIIIDNPIYTNLHIDEQRILWYVVPYTGHSCF